MQIIQKFRIELKILKKKGIFFYKTAKQKFASTAERANAAIKICENAKKPNIKRFIN